MEKKEGKAYGGLEVERGGRVSSEADVCLTYEKGFLKKLVSYARVCHAVGKIADCVFFWGWLGKM